MAKALVISSFFPPLHSAGGSIRLVKFISHMSRLGWEFVIFTRNVPGAFLPQEKLSSFLLDELPSNVVIHRVPAPSLGEKPGKNASWIQKKFFKVFGESSLGWGIRTLWKAFSYSRKNKVDVIFGVTPPFTNALVATLLAWRGKWPLVLDLKDDWVGSPMFLQKNRLRQSIEKLLESLIVRYASAVITVTPQSFRLYKERYDFLHCPEKFHLVPNGCDLEEYDRLMSRDRRIVSNKFTILSAAWGFRKDYRDITPFFIAVDLFIKKHPEARESVDVVLLGDSLSNDYDALLSERGLLSIVRSVGAVNREALVEWLWKANLFLLVQPVGNTTAVSGTLYEYWATGKSPILLISERGASSTLVEENQLGRHFHFDQIEEMADYIENVYSSYQKNEPLLIRRNGIENYDRRTLANQMSAIWYQILTIGK